MLDKPYPYDCNMEDIKDNVVNSLVNGTAWVIRKIDVYDNEGRAFLIRITSCSKSGNCLGMRGKNNNPGNLGFEFCKQTKSL